MQNNWGGDCWYVQPNLTTQSHSFILNQRKQRNVHCRMYVKEKLAVNRPNESAERRIVSPSMVIRFLFLSHVQTAAQQILFSHWKIKFSNWRRSFKIWWIRIKSRGKTISGGHVCQNISLIFAQWCYFLPQLLFFFILGFVLPMEPQTQFWFITDIGGLVPSVHSQFWGETQRREAIDVSEDDICRKQITHEQVLRE